MKKQKLPQELLDMIDGGTLFVKDANGKSHQIEKVEYDASQNAVIFHTTEGLSGGYRCTRRSQEQNAKIFQDWVKYEGDSYTFNSKCTFEKAIED